VEYAVATLGTATTPTHITKLMRQTDEIVFCFDGDAAGRKAAWRAAMNSLPALTDNLRLRFLFLPAEHDPDTYIREYGKAGFEAAMDGAMPLSQYIVNTLCADNDLQSQEDKVRLLNDAEPILKEIKAPRTAMMMRKKLAELTGISTAELEQNLDLRPTKAARKRFAPRMNRKPPTLVRRLMQMLLYRPELGAQLDPRLIQGDGDEENVLRRLQSLTSTPPYPSPAGLLEAVRNDIPVPLMNELLAELLELEESFAVEDEFVGALKQLQGNRQGLDLVTVLKMAQEHGLQALTAEQRAVVQQFRKPSAGN
jgi:DNA primase